MLTFRIKPNDEVTLKSCFRDIDVSEIDKQDLKLFSGKLVIVCRTGKTHRTQIHSQSVSLQTRYWMTVRDRSGHLFECPIEFISKSYALRRDHKRYKLHKYKLICE